jgi:hypothetical protein
MTQIDTLFNRLDAWRHFPNYQLERRADIFFSLYLPEVLEDKLGFPIREELIPEFPVHKATIQNDVIGDKSFKIDYIALSNNDENPIKAVLVELKTDGASVNPSQTDYLTAASNVGLKELLKGLLKIFRASNSKPKYYRLLTYLDNLDLLHIPKELKECMLRPFFEGANEASKLVDKWLDTTLQSIETQIVYVIPNIDGLKNQVIGNHIKIITFEDVASIVRRSDDFLSNRFAESLDKWANCKAGEV